jgi:hypothetical protein
LIRAGGGLNSIDDRQLLLRRAEVLLPVRVRGKPVLRQLFVRLLRLSAPLRT